jgi:hypothetical protein
VMFVNQCEETRSLTHQLGTRHVEHSFAKYGFKYSFATDTSPQVFEHGFRQTFTTNKSLQVLGNRKNPPANVLESAHCRATHSKDCEAIRHVCDTFGHRL